MKNKHQFALPLLWLSFLFVPLFTSAQLRVSSPYSRFGVGNLFQNPNPVENAMGGVTYGIRNNNSVNLMNPAAYTATDTLSFVFEAGLSNRLSQLKTNNLSQNSNYLTLSHIAFSFPLSKKWAGAAGLVPFSHVGYKIADMETLSNIGRVKYLYEGDGGINRFFMGFAFKPSRNFSLGLNANYLFGNMEKIRTISFPDSLYLYSIRLINSNFASDIMLSGGMQFTKTFSDDKSLVVGLTSNLPLGLSVKSDTSCERFYTNSVGTEYIQDTVIQVTGIKGKMNIPLSVGGGLVFRQQNAWLCGIDVTWQNWKNFNAFGKTDSLKNSLMISAGGQFTPNQINEKTNPTYFRRITYRFGVRYHQSYLQLRNTPLNEYGISFGLGFPVARTKSLINLSVEMGQMGTTQHNLIKENYARITLGFSFYERWFMKPKYD